MNYKNIKPEIKEFFIKDYSQKAAKLREKAANPKARKAAEFTKNAETFESIVEELKVA